MNIKLTKNEIQELLWALYDSERLNREYASNNVITGNEIKPVDFLRVGNKPINTVFEKLMNAKYIGVN